MTEVYSLRKRIMAAALCGFGTIALSACSEIRNGFAYQPTAGPTSTYPPEPEPVFAISPDLVKASETFTERGRDIARKIVSAALDDQSQAKGVGQYGFNNSRYARSPEQVATRFPEISIDYKPNRDRLYFRSTDWLQPNNDASLVAGSEVELYFYLKPDNALDDLVDQGKKLDPLVVSQALDANGIELRYAKVVQEFTLVQTNAERNLDTTYIYQRHVPDNETPTISDPARPSDLGSLMDQAEQIQQAHQNALD